MVRTLNRVGPTDCRETVRCAAEGCAERTRDGKPFCPAHVELHPYVRTLQETLRAQQDEQERVARRGPRAVDPDGLTAKELLLQLWLYGDRTVERLCRDLQLESGLVQSYAKALERHGRVTLHRTQRGLISLRAVLTASQPALTRELHPGNPPALAHELVRDEVSAA